MSEKKESGLPFPSDLLAIGMKLNLSSLERFFLLTLRAGMNAKNPLNWRSQQRLANEMGCSRRKVVQIVAKLQKIGLLEAEKRKGGSSRYRLILGPEGVNHSHRGCEPRSQGGVNHVHMGCEPRSQGGVNHVPINTLKGIKQKNKQAEYNHPPPPPSRGSGALEEEDDSTPPPPQQKTAEAFCWISKKKKIFEKILFLKKLERIRTKREKLEILEKRLEKIENPEKLEEIEIKVSQKIEEKTRRNLGKPALERLSTLKAEMVQIQSAAFFEELDAKDRLKFIDLATEFISIKTEDPEFPRKIDEYVSFFIEKSEKFRKNPIVHPERYRAKIKYQIFHGQSSALTDFLKWGDCHPVDWWYLDHLNPQELAEWTFDFYSLELEIPNAEKREGKKGTYYEDPEEDDDCPREPLVRIPEGMVIWRY